MLIEFDNVRQIHGEDRRRLFTDDDIALYVWFRNARISGFQLCYDKQGPEKAFMWTLAHGYAHYAVDSGEVGGLDAKKTPVFAASAIPVSEDILDRFIAASNFLDAEIRDFVSQKIRDYLHQKSRKL